MEGLRTLIEPLADYIAAAADTDGALREVVSELLVRTSAIESEACRYLAEKRS